MLWRWLPAIALLAAGCPKSGEPDRPEPEAPTGPPGEVLQEPGDGRGAQGPGREPEPVASPEPREAGGGADPVTEPEPPDREPARPEAGEPPGALRGIVAAHNRYRARHCAPPLEWSAEVAAAAQRWADSLRDRGCAFEHSPGMKYGENLAFASPAGSHSARGAVDGWYREVKDYDFGRARFEMRSGHFTQVVWRASRRLGCGYARCGERAELWVCNYDPAGNVHGEFGANVLPSSCDR